MSSALDGPWQRGKTTPYLDMLRANVPAARVEIIPNTGHFAQIDKATQVNELLDDFIGSLGAATRVWYPLGITPTHGREPHEGIVGIDFLPCPV